MDHGRANTVRTQDGGYVVDSLDDLTPIVESEEAEVPAARLVVGLR